MTTNNNVTRFLVNPKIFPVSNSVGKKLRSGSLGEFWYDAAFQKNRAAVLATHFHPSVFSRPWHELGKPSFSLKMLEITSKFHRYVRPLVLPVVVQ